MTDSQSGPIVGGAGPAGTGETDQELQLLRDQNHSYATRYAALLSESAKVQQSLSSMIAELASRQRHNEQLTSENEALRKEVAALGGDGWGPPSPGRTERARYNDARSGGDPSKKALHHYVERSFAVGCDPNIPLMRSLFDLHELDSADTLLSFAQLQCLLFVIQASHGDGLTRSFRKVSLWCDGAEGINVVADIIALLPNLNTVRLGGIDAVSALAVAGSLAVLPHVDHLELPSLRADDRGLQAILRVVAQREAAHRAAVAAMDPSPPPLLRLCDLDLSRCIAHHSSTFSLIRGESIRSLSFRKNAEITDAWLGDVLRFCPSLERLDVSDCPRLTQEAVLYFNIAHKLGNVNLVNNHAIHSLTLRHVVTLFSSLRGVSVLDAGALEEIATPVSSFALVTWNTPKLARVTFSNVSLQSRELTLLQHVGGTLTSLTLLGCRITDAHLFFRHMRVLRHLEMPRCKGLTVDDFDGLTSALETLDLADHFALTNGALDTIGRRCPRLRRLSLQRCTGISDPGIACLRKLQQLVFLDVLGIRGKVTAAALQELCERIPTLETVGHETFAKEGVTSIHDVVNVSAAPPSTVNEGARSSPRVSRRSITTELIASLANATPIDFDTSPPRTASSRIQ